MYLTGGQFKGHKVIVPQDVKPTLSKVRQGVFNMLSCYDFSTFLDMFAGSALMGLEAISRGYKVKELEINPKNISIINKNYQNIKKNPDITLIDSLKYKTDFKYDIVYCDPPWGMEYSKVLKKACELSKKDGLIILEYDRQGKVDIEKLINDFSNDISLLKLKKYGRCGVCLLEKK